MIGNVVGAKHYQILEKIGEGGMAEVFKAVAVTADGAESIVVLKRILPHLANDEEYVTMFVDEARIASSLDHRNIARMLDIGRMDGQIFLALEFIDGADLRELLRRGEEGGSPPLTLSSVLFIVREVLHALSYAHLHRDPDGRVTPIVHRDVSPQNVIVSRAGEVKLVDFGIARKHGIDSRTAVGMVKGNALYLTPEQASGGPIDARTDVYQAGLLLLTLALGRNPFESETLSSLVERARTANVPPPTRWRPDLPSFVDDLVAGATRLEPPRRYASALVFAQRIEEVAARERIPLDPKSVARDLEWAFTAGTITSTESIATMGKPADKIGPRTEVFLEPLADGTPAPLGLMDFLDALAPLADAARLEDLSEDERTVLSLPSASGTAPAKAAPLAPASTPTRAPHEVEEFTHTARSPIPVPIGSTFESTQVSAPQLPPEAPEEGTMKSPIVSPERTQVSAQALPPEPEPEPETSAPSGDEAPPEPENPFTTPSELAIAVSPLPANAVTIRAHKGPVRGRAVAAAVARGLSGGDDGILRVWNLAAGRADAELRAHEGGVSALAISADGGTAVSSGLDGTVRAWDLREGGSASLLEARAGVRALSLSADGAFAAGGGDERALLVWDILRRRVVQVFDGHSAPITSASLFADRMRAVSGSEDGTVRIWSLEASAEIALLRADAPVYSLALSADGGIVLAGEDSGAVSVWSVDSASQVNRIALHGTRVTALCLSADGSVALSGAADGSVVRWDVRRSEALACYAAHEGEVTSVVLAPDGVHALSAGEDGCIRGW